MTRVAWLAPVLALACAPRPTGPSIAPTRHAPPPGIPDPDAAAPPPADLTTDVDALRAHLDDPQPPASDGVALVDAVGRSTDPAAVDLLLEVLRRPADAQPIEMHRAAATALGRQRDPKAVPDLLAVIWRVPDAPSTRNLGERVKVALSAIGEPAVAPLLRVLDGDDPEIAALTTEAGVEPQWTMLSAAMYLGAIGSPRAVEPLRRHLGEATDPMARAVLANALGFIGDPAPIPDLCARATASHDPGEAFPMVEALGRIGGPAALSCLQGIVRKGSYDRDLVAKAEFVHEIRWEAGRFAVLAAAPSEADTLAKLFATARGHVAEELEAWSLGVELMKRCGDVRDCYLVTLVDANAPWFSREVAATQLARLAPGDLDVALAITEAFAVRNPDARVTMAWLPARMLRGQRCPACADHLDAIVHAETGELPPEYQLSVIVARTTMAALGDRGEPAW